MNRLEWLFSSRMGARGRLIPRWIFLRALAAIYFSAFFALLFQIEGLNGPLGIIPTGRYLAALGKELGGSALGHLWNAPTLFWWHSGAGFMMGVMWVGIAASVAAFLNLWPRVSFLVCFVCFLSFVAGAADFSGYQSDGMLLEAGFLALFFAPPGWLPGWGSGHPPMRAALWLLQWEWFRIYFESGLVKVLSGDSSWHNGTAMIGYYQNSPLPTWVGWYAGHLPNWFQRASTVGTLVMELALVLMLFLPRPLRIACFFIVTPWEIAVILTGNYAFLNYIVLSLGVLLLDDRFLMRFVPARFRSGAETAIERAVQTVVAWKLALRGACLAVSALMLSWIAYDTTAGMITIVLPNLPLPNQPVKALEPFRIANQYGLFAVMTSGRYEIEFQGSNDRETWTAYPFRYKPQALNERPRIYAPYQPRFDWNLWFASLRPWQQNDIVPITQARLLQNDSAALGLFRANPFAGSPPKYVRAVLWQYWFTSMDEKRATGNWWKRQMLGQYSPTMTLTEDGDVQAVDAPVALPSHD